MTSNLQGFCLTNIVNLEQCSVHPLVEADNEGVGGGEGEIGQHPAHGQQRPGVGGGAGGRVQVVDTAGVQVTLVHVSTTGGGV